VLPSQDVNVPIKWLSDLFDKYLPNTIHEMIKSFSHITPLGTMNFVTVRCSLGTQSPAAVHAHDKSAVAHEFVLLWLAPEVTRW
jgi:hypothetical protein